MKIDGRLKGNPRNTNKYIALGNITIIETKKGDKFIIDTEDADVAKKCCWSKHETGYAVGQINKKKVRLHRLILIKHNLLKEDTNMIVDHINRDRSDNRKDNLNVILKKYNPQNHSMYKNNKSGHNNISIEPNGKYRVKVGNKYVGLFINLEEAIKARDVERDKMFNYLKKIS